MRACPSSIPLGLVLAPALLAGCTATGGRSTVTVRATDTVCAVSKTKLAPGSYTFTVTNKGTTTTEVYVYGRSGGGFTRIIGEKEDIGPGTSATLRADLAKGSYQVACKPGQRGDGIRTTVAVG
ncbi:MAG: cupredoxin domain-containing protein [Actinomycetota bacterium]|nr:cupredoxin domain-containing protein [Actinomycetota bacterium]